MDQYAMELEDFAWEDAAKNAVSAAVLRTQWGEEGSRKALLDGHEYQSFIEYVKILSDFATAAWRRSCKLKGALSECPASSIVLGVLVDCAKTQLKGVGWC